MRTWLERVPADSKTPKHLERWKAMRREGWELSVLLYRLKPELVALGFLPEGDTKMTLGADTGLRPSLEISGGRQ